MTDHSNLQIGDVVQLNPETLKDSFFAGCFMVITDLKDFGAQGYISIPGKRGETPSQAYFRAKWDDMICIGHAEWVIEDGLESE